MQVSVWLVPGRHEWHCRDEGAEEEEGCARGNEMGWRSRDAREPRRAWEKGRPLEVQVDLEGKEGSLLAFSAKSVVFLSLECHHHQVRKLKSLTAFTAPEALKPRLMLDCLRS